MNMWMDDEGAIASHWDLESSRLFVGQNEIFMRVIDVGREHYIIRSEEQLRHLVKSPLSATRVFLVPQEFSWGSLTVSESCARLLISQLQAFPPFLEILKAFGQRTEPSNETLGGFSTQPRQDLQSCERTYLLKCIERHGREHLVNPWAIRQFAVYHDDQRNGGIDSLIVVNPSASLMLSQKMKLLQNANQDVPSSETIHLIMISAACQKWTDYISWLEQELYPLTIKAHVVQEEPGDEQASSSFEVTTLDMQRLQILQNSMHQAIHVLNMNEITIESLARDLWPSFCNHGSSLMNEPNPSRIRMCLALLEGAQRRLKTLLGRSEAVSMLMQHIMSTRLLATLDDSSKMTTELGKLAREDNRLMLAMAVESQHDSRTLKTITVLTLAYLPASFVSTLLGMQYISINSSDGHWSMQFKPEMWIFAVLSIVLLIVTFGLWYGFELRKRQKEQEGPCERSPDPEMGGSGRQRVHFWRSDGVGRNNIVNEKHAVMKVDGQPNNNE